MRTISVILRRKAEHASPCGISSTISLRSHQTFLTCDLEMSSHLDTQSKILSLLCSLELTAETPFLKSPLARCLVSEIVNHTWWKIGSFHQISKLINKDTKHKTQTLILEYYSKEASLLALCPKPSIKARDTAFFSW